MKRYIVLIIMMTIIGVLAFLAYESLSYKSRMDKLGYELMQKIDSYKEKHGHLPKDLSEIGIDGDFHSNHFKGGIFYYTISNDSTYWLEYSLDAENNRGISSAKRIWQEDYAISISKQGFFNNFQVTYCSESIGICSYHIIQYKEKTYDPMVILAYRKSSLDSMLWLGTEGYLDYSISDLKSDSKFFQSMKEAWDIEESKNVQIKDGKIIDNGRELPIEDIVGDEYYCHNNDKLAIYKFVNTIVLPPTTINNEEIMEDDIPIF